VRSLSEARQRPDCDDGGDGCQAEQKPYDDPRCYAWNLGLKPVSQLQKQREAPVLNEGPHMGSQHIANDLFHAA
jgi:hypothetical protein